MTTFLREDVTTYVQIPHWLILGGYSALWLTASAGEALRIKRRILREHLETRENP